MNKKLIIGLLLLMFLALCGCYRQTTVILQPGETLPKHATLVTETAETESETAGTSSAEQTETAPAATAAKPAAQSKPTPSGSKKPKPDATEPTDAAKPAETTVPEATAAQTATPEATAQETIAPETTIATETTSPPTQPPAHSVYDISGHSVGSYERSILEEVNRYRADAGVSSFTMNKKLSALAAIRAYECTKEFSHTRPNGRSWDTVLSDYGASASTENILYASSGTDAALVIATCMDSDSHSRKIMNADYHSIGIGICDIGTYVYIVMIFA